MTVSDRLFDLLSSTRRYRPGMDWEWRISRDVWEAIRPEGVEHPIGLQLLGIPARVMDDATPGTIGMVSA